MPINTPEFTPSDILAQLLEGNQRFIKGERRRRADLEQILARLRAPQHVVATVVCCSDSRVAPEGVFDVELGELFVVRTAGGVVTAASLGSIEYSCLYAGSSLVFVLGHDDCGAIRAAIQHLLDRYTPESDAIGSIVQAILPCAATIGEDEDVATAVRSTAIAHVENTMAHIINNSQPLRRLMEKGLVGVAGGLLSHATGKVHLLPKTPDQIP